MQNNINNQKDIIHLKFQKEDGSNFTLSELEFDLRTTKEAIERWWKENENITSQKELDELSPEIVFVENGCIDFSILVTEVLVNVLSEILKIAFKNIANIRKNKNKKMFAIELKCRNFWDPCDDYAVSVATIKNYIVDKNTISATELAKSLILSKKYSLNSVRLKILNSVYLLEEHSLLHSCPNACIKRYSKQNKIELEKALTNLRII